MTENIDINNFISLHQLLYPNEKFNIIEINNVSVRIKYICNHSGLNISNNLDNEIEI